MRRYRTSLERRQTSADRRRELVAANRCINGPKESDVGHRGVKHGPVVRGGKCQRCINVHRGVEVAA